MPEEKTNLELAEFLDRLASSGQHAQDVETNLLLVSISSRLIAEWSSGRMITHSLAERSALADGDLVTLLNTERGRNVGGEVLVSLLITGVLGDEVQVLSSDNESSVHLGGDDSAGQDTATDRNEASEGALLVCGQLSVKPALVVVRLGQNSAILHPGSLCASIQLILKFMAQLCLKLRYPHQCIHPSRK